MGNTILKLGKMCISLPEEVNSEENTIIERKRQKPEIINPIKLKYKIEECLGHGGNGLVHAGVRRSDGEKVVLKYNGIWDLEYYHSTLPWEDKANVWKSMTHLLWRDVPDIPSIPNSFLINKSPFLPKEVQLLASLQGIEGVANIVDYYTGPGDLNVIVMERTSGNTEDLCDFACNHSLSQLLNEDTAKWIFRQVVSSVRKCYKRGVVHGDIKEENIVIDPFSGQVSLIDFGSGFFRDESCTNKYQGTLQLNAPEYFTSQELDSEAMTVWSLGALLFSMIYGYPTFEKLIRVTEDCHYSFNDLFNQADERLRKINGSLPRKKPYVSQTDADSLRLPSRECKHLIWRCLRRQSSDRISLDDIWTHPALDLGSYNYMYSHLNCRDHGCKHNIRKSHSSKPSSLGSYSSPWISGIHFLQSLQSLTSSTSSSDNHVHSTPIINLSKKDTPEDQFDNTSYEDLNNTYYSMSDPVGEMIAYEIIAQQVIERKPWNLWVDQKTKEDSALSIQEFEPQCQIRCQRLIDLAKKNPTQGSASQIQVYQDETGKYGKFDFLYFDPKYNQNFWDLWGQLENYAQTFTTMMNEGEHLENDSLLKLNEHCLEIISEVKATELEILTEEGLTPVLGVLHIGLQKEWIRLYNQRVKWISKLKSDYRHPKSIQVSDGWVPNDQKRRKIGKDFLEDIKIFKKQTRSICSSMINSELKDGAKEKINRDSYELIQDGIPYLEFGDLWNYEFCEIFEKMVKLYNVVGLILDEEENWGPQALIEMSVVAMENIIEIKKMEVRFMKEEGLTPVLGVLHIGLQNEYIRLHHLRIKWMMETHTSAIRNIIKDVQQRANCCTDED